MICLLNKGIQTVIAYTVDLKMAQDFPSVLVILAIHRIPCDNGNDRKIFERDLNRVILLIYI